MKICFEDIHLTHIHSIISPRRGLVPLATGASPWYRAKESPAPKGRQPISPTDLSISFERSSRRIVAVTPSGLGCFPDRNHGLAPVAIGTWPLRGDQRKDTKVNFVILYCLLFCLFAAAHAAVQDWQQAYQLDAGYRQAERAVATATDDVQKLRDDPDTPPLDLARAKETLAIEQAKFRMVKLAATTRALTAVGDVLVWRRKFAAAEAAWTVCKLQLHAAEARQAAGMLSAQELAKAQKECADAETEMKNDKRELLGAEIRVKIYVETPPEQLPPVPPLEEKSTGFDGHPDLLSAQAQCNEAERALVFAEGPDTAPLTRKNRARAVRNAQDALVDVGRVLRDGLDTALRRWPAAREQDELTMEHVKLAQLELRTAKRRFDAGAIAQLDWQQALLAALKADTAREEALVEIWQARLAVARACGGAL